MIKYKTRSVRFGVHAEIIPVEVSRETDESIWLPRGRMERKRCESQCYHNTWADAKEYLLRHAQQHVDLAENKLEYSKRTLRYVLDLKEPE